MLDRLGDTAHSWLCSIARPCVLQKKLSRPRWLDRDGEEVITKVVAGRRNQRYRHSVQVAI
jgi:hypothetical protein